MRDGTRSGVEPGEAEELLEGIAGGEQVASIGCRGMPPADQLDVVGGDVARRTDERFVAGLQGVTGVQGTVSAVPGACVRNRRWNSTSRRKSLSTGGMAVDSMVV